MSSNTLHILVFDESVSRMALLIDALHAAGFTRVTSLHDTSNLVEVVIKAKPDVVLIEVDSPSRDTLEQLTSLRDRRPTAVMMISQDQQAQSIHAAVASGVCAYSVEGVCTQRVKPAIEVAMATFESFKALRAQLAKAREELHCQKRIDRAKCILIRQQGLSEPDAHAALRKLAMDRKRKLVDVADDLIAMAKLFQT